ncbi:MAG: Ig-like domain-containing protein [Lachnospiraceae bacterium]|nr:Ig-like domain-containing protein [Lachnospiraceae bacterium]
MMKSFFKKLAFVMALAMVVSMVAPAGDAFAATTGIALQNTDTIVTEFPVEKVGATVDFCFKGAPADWKTTYEWTSSNEDVATVDKAGVVTAVAPGTAVITITAGADKSYVETVKVVVKEAVEELTAKQKTAKTVKVTFTENHNFDATGADDDGVNTVKVYRVFSTEEMAKMANKNGLKFDEEGNGYQAYYVMDVDVNYFENGDKDFTTWTIAGYDWFVDGAKYAVVYGPNETSSTIEGIMATFTAYVGKVAKIVVSATQATVENDVEQAIPAKLTTKLYNKQDIDLTDYYNNADETDYELLTDDIDVSVSGNEVTFDEVGSAKVLGSYTFYDEDLEEDVVLTDDVTVLGGKYSAYRVESIYNWSVDSFDDLKDDFTPDWKTTSTEMIAGDDAQLYVIVKDNRGHYYSNVPGIELKNVKVNGEKVLEIGNDSDENTPFEQYGYELVFDSLDPDSLLVDPDGYVTTYKKTNSFAVVSYKRSDDEAAKLHEIGVMGIKVKAPRVIDSVKYNNGTSFTVLKETEAEDNIPDYYGAHSDYKYDDFKLSAQLKIEFLNQYGQTWGSNAEDYYDVTTNFTVTTSKDDFIGVAEDIAHDLNTQGYYDIDAKKTFGDSSATSVTFKIKESATGDSTNVTIKLDKPKYVLDTNGDPTTEVYVDPAKAVMDVAGKELYKSVGTDAKLFQVSKASQKVGYVRVGSLENDEDEDRNYYLANQLIKTNFTVIDADEEKQLDDFLTTATESALKGLKEDDYILVVTDPSGKLVPEAGKGGNGLAVDAESGIGLVASEDGTHFDFILAAEDKPKKDINGDNKVDEEDSVLEYATAGTYRATVYKVTNVTPVKNSDDVEIGTKYTVSRVSSDSFTITQDFKAVSFFHQETTKNVEDVAAFDGEASIMTAIAQTMTFRIAGQDLKFEAKDGDVYFDTYKNYMRCDCHNWKDFAHDDLRVELIDVDYKIQEGGARAVVNTATFRVYTLAKDADGTRMWYDCKVKVNRSVNATK